MPVNFDATVTIQTLIYSGMAFAAVLTFIIGAVGSKLFPGKAEFTGGVAKLERLIEKISFDTRESMQTEIARLESRATERYDHTKEDLDRIEGVCEAALEEARTAARTATEAMHTSDTAMRSAERSEKLVDGLLTRQREGDRRP